MKRGQSGLSLLVAVDKPSGMSSHDVVNACRRIFGERRVGHTGTLDPLATGLLPICVGPATRLDNYLTGHDKGYLVSIGFGFETTTDDAEGQVSAEGPVDHHLKDMTFAASFIESLVGVHEQLPPQYSAIKVNGVKSYEAARRGTAVDLEYRTITVHEASLESISYDMDSGVLCWNARFVVSKGTYIRSLARDIGRMLGTYAHVRSLRRFSSGALCLEEAVSLETLATLGERAAIDPVRVLGFRYAYADDIERAVNSGNALRQEQLSLWEAPRGLGPLGYDLCTNTASQSTRAPYDGEPISVIMANRLKSIYRFDSGKSLWKADCVFSTSIVRS